MRVRSLRIGRTTSYTHVSSACSGKKFAAAGSVRWRVQAVLDHISAPASKPTRAREAAWVTKALYGDDRRQTTDQETTDKENPAILSVVYSSVVSRLTQPA